MTSTRWPLLACWVAAAVIATAIAPDAALACSMAPARVVCLMSTHGWHWDETKPSQVPRNVAVPTGCDIEDADGEPVELGPVDASTELQRPAVPLEPGAPATVGGLAVTVTEVVDESPPGEVTIAGGRLRQEGATGRGCSGTDCAYWAMVLEVQPPEDDHAAAEDLTYAIYLGSTEEEARAAERPAMLLAPDPEGLLRQVQPALNPLWVAIAPLDLAGNQGPRTEPILLRRHDDLCAAGGGAGQVPWIGLALALLALLGRSRR